VRLRVVFDTNVVLSALVFTGGRLDWLRRHWQLEEAVPLVSRYTTDELLRILAYPRFKLTMERQIHLLADYLPFCERIVTDEAFPIPCRDPKDQPLLDLAHCGKADALVTGDEDLLALAGQTGFVIETPEEYRQHLNIGYR
jgi:putative PIN family toxin of toxin-antitoxin system